MEALLYELNSKLFAAMKKYEEQIGDDNEYVSLVSQCLDIIAIVGNVSEERHQEIIDQACNDVYYGGEE